MKTHLLAAALASTLLASTTLQAAPAQKLTQVECAEMCKDMDPESCRTMSREMLKREDLHEVMAKELKENKNFYKTWGNVTTGGG